MADGFVLVRTERGVVAARIVGMRFSSDGKVPIFDTSQAPWPIEIPEHLTGAISGLLDRLEEVARGA